MNTPAPRPHNPRMQQHSMHVEWVFVVPPQNDQRIVISQRQDGPFRADRVGGPGHYHVSREQLAPGSRWEHVAGSATGGHRSFEIAYEIAERAWLAAIPGQVPACVSVPVEPPMSLLVFAAGYSSVEGLSDSDRQAVLDRFRKQWATILATGAGGGT